MDPGGLIISGLIGCVDIGAKSIAYKRQVAWVNDHSHSGIKTKIHGQLSFHEVMFGVNTFARYTISIRVNLTPFWNSSGIYCGIYLEWESKARHIFAWKHSTCSI